MDIKKNAKAGTLESSDAEVEVFPSDKLEIEVKSTVYAQFGKQIEDVIKKVVDNFDVKSGKIKVDDRGALDCTIKSRVETAIFRANDMTENLPWGDRIWEEA